MRLSRDGQEFLSANRDATEKKGVGFDPHPPYQNRINSWVFDGPCLQNEALPAIEGQGARDVELGP